MRRYMYKDQQPSPRSWWYWRCLRFSCVSFSPIWPTLKASKFKIVFCIFELGRDKDADRALKIFFDLSILGAINLPRAFRSCRKRGLVGYEVRLNKDIASAYRFWRYEMHRAELSLPPACDAFNRVRLLIHCRPRCQLCWFLRRRCILLVDLRLHRRLGWFSF